MKLRSLLSIALSAVILVGAPGLPAYHAAAAIVGSSPAPRAWAPAVSGLAARSAAGTLSLNADAARVLAHSGFELGTGSAQGLSRLPFVAHLPAAYRQDPRAFSALEASAQKQLLEQAIAAAAAELAAEAGDLLRKYDFDAIDGVELSDADAKRFAFLADRFFYLDAEQSAKVRAVHSSLTEWALSGKSKSLADALFSGKRAEPTLQSALSSELGALIKGAEAVVEAGGASFERDAVVRDRLAPYAERQLKAAAERLKERGVPQETIYLAVLAGHRPLWGGSASRSLLKTLRPSGAWTDFVAAVTIAATQALETAAPTAAKSLLPMLANEDDFKIRIPAWHALSGEHRTVAAWYEANHGKVDRPMPAEGLKLFTLFKIPVRAGLSFLLIAGFVSYQLSQSFFPRIVPGLEANIYMLQGVAAAVALYASVIAHEFGHALTGRLFGINTKQIVLNLLGGVAYLEKDPRSAKAEFWIAIAGPLVSLAIGLAAFFIGMPLAAGLPLLKPILMYLGLANIMLAVFNMVPAFPMDGGRVLRSLAQALTKDNYKATRFASFVGIGFSFLFTGWGLWSVLHGNIGGIIMVMIGMMISGAAKQSLKHPGTIIDGEKGS